MKGRLIIVSITLIGITAASWMWWSQAIKPINPENTTPITFTITPGTSVRSIAEQLKNADLIRSSVAFFLYVRFKGYDGSIQAGDFRLNQSMDMVTVIESLTHGTVDVWVTIPEGWRNAQIAQVLSQEMSIPESEFLKVAKEGYMFPDTYLLPKDASAGAAAQIFQKNFEKKITPAMLSQMQQKGMTLDTVVTIASLVEREARLSEDRPLIASVILNRLHTPMKLDIDATVQYALGYQSQEKSWWKKDLTYDDLEMSSLYNTYTHLGLPPTPISNPGIASIQAVINAPDTEYLFYVADHQGKSHFAKTLEEHQQNISRYR